MHWSRACGHQWINWGQLGQALGNMHTHTSRLSMGLSTDQRARCTWLQEWSHRSRNPSSFSQRLKHLPSERRLGLCQHEHRGSCQINPAAVRTVPRPLWISAAASGLRTYSPPLPEAPQRARAVFRGTAGAGSLQSAQCGRAQVEVGWI